MDTVVFWDFDGTITHSDPLWSSSVYEALKNTDGNTKVIFEEIRKHMAYGFTWHTPDKDYRTLTNEKWWEFMNAHIYNSYIKLGVKENIAESAVKKVRSIIKRKDKYILYDDAVYVLKELKNKGVKNVILSNNYPDLKETLVKLEILNYFDDVIISAVEGYDKPRKELFDIAKNRYPDSEYYMVGDSVIADITGGNNAGMTTILVHKGYNEKADYCFDNLIPIIDLIP